MTWLNMIRYADGITEQGVGYGGVVPQSKYELNLTVFAKLFCYALHWKLCNYSHLFPEKLHVRQP